MRYIELEHDKIIEIPNGVGWKIKDGMLYVWALYKGSYRWMPKGKVKNDAP